MTNSSTLRIGLLQFAPKLGDIRANTDKIENLLEESQPANLWVLPELASSGYNFSSLAEAEATSEPLNQSKYIDFLISKAQTLDTWFISGFNERENHRLYNSSVLIGPKGIMGIYRKIHLFNREKLFFHPGNKGLPVFDTPYGKTGMLICFDWMFPEVWRLMALKGAQIICHPSNLVLPFCQTAIPGYALTNKIFVATTNRVGKEGDLEFTGQSVLVNPRGEYLLKGSRKNEDVMTVKIDLAEANDKQVTPLNHAFDDRHEEIYSLHEKPGDTSLMNEKKNLRREIKELKQQYTPDQLKETGINVMNEFEKHPRFISAKTIFLYWSLPDEVPTHEFIEKWSKEKKILLPRVVGDHLELREYASIESLETGTSYGIQEPTGPVFTDFENVDLVVTPGLAFSAQGARLGRGGGYYDRTLPFLSNAYKVGVGFSFQILKYVPYGELDIMLDEVVSNSDIQPERLI